VMNFKEEFRQSVIENFIDEYAAGRTPNPCVQCNKHVKFDFLLRKMQELGCSKLVTGHYARIRFVNDRYRLMQARGTGKDQSYVLFMLGQDELSQTWFPLGDMPSKDATRSLASSLGLHLADKPDSQEICFVSEAGGYAEFLRKQRPEMFSEGAIVDRSGDLVGMHSGTAGFTIGQRRGVGVATGKPLYVLELKPKENLVVVGSTEQLMRREVLLSDLYAAEDLTGPKRVRAKIRYNMESQPATLYSDRLIFDEPVRAVTPGQFAVAYRGKTVVAGGTIS
jgi:tRNA-specific 2-thiouridylase